MVDSNLSNLSELKFANKTKCFTNYFSNIMCLSQGVKVVKNNDFNITNQEAIINEWVIFQLLLFFKVFR